MTTDYKAKHDEEHKRRCDLERRFDHRISGVDIVERARIHAMDHLAFRAGFHRGMINVGAGDTDAGWRKAIRDGHTADFSDGFNAALDHFDGHNTHGTDLAYLMGLPQAYAGFHGQSDFKHPTTLPGHSPGCAR